MKNAAYDIMPIEHIPDWETRLANQDAFWKGELDCPTALLERTRPNPDYPMPAAPRYETPREQWFDAEYQAAKALASVMGRQYHGDALPHVFPNLGPDVFSAYFGAKLEYAETTSWSEPLWKSWDDARPLRFSPDNVYFKKTLELTDAMLEAGKGKFYVGVTDLHPGGDALAALRDPMELNIDLIESPERVKQALEWINAALFQIQDYFYDKLRGAGQAMTTWMGIVSSKRWYVPSNDFSCMVSPEMFQEFFLPGIKAECDHLASSVYHLDGPGALGHLDSLLSIDSLNAIQWVYGAGQGRASDWLDVYRRIQAAGKGIYLSLYPDELDLFIDNLKPNGVWLKIEAPNVSADEAERLVAKARRWKR